MFPQASAKVEVDMEKAEKLQVTRGDFLASLENDIKPVSCILTPAFGTGIITFVHMWMYIQWVDSGIPNNYNYRGKMYWADHCQLVVCIERDLAISTLVCAISNLRGD